MQEGAGVKMPGWMASRTCVITLALALVVAVLGGLGGACDPDQTASPSTSLVPPPPGISQPAGTGVEITVTWPPPDAKHPPYLLFRTDRRYTDTHLWLKQESADTVRIGITYYGQLALGILDDFGMPAVGTPLVKGQSFGCFLVGNDCMIYDFAAPVDGAITAVNESFLADRTLINTAPYDDGWLLEVRLAGPVRLDTFLTAQAYYTLCCPPCHCAN